MADGLKSGRELDLIGGDDCMGDKKATGGTAERAWQGIPGIERTPRGRIFVVWFSGGTHEPQPENTVYLTYSDDDAQTWAPLSVMAEPRDGARAFDPTLWLDPTGCLWLIFNRGNPEKRIHDVHARRCAAPDAPVPAWGAEYRLGFDEVPFSFRMNKPIVLSTGEWVLPVTHDSQECREWFARDRQVQGVAISADQGRSWRLHGAVQAPPWALENMIVELRDGRLWMLIRTSAGVLWESFSTDRGRTWSAGAATTIASPGSRFFIRRLASGRLLLVSHYKFTGRSHLTALLSPDEGRTWQEGLVLDARENVSYPDGFQAPDALIWIVYDRERKGAGDILLARFPEADIEAGRLVSPDASLRYVLDTLRPRSAE